MEDEKCTWTLEKARIKKNIVAVGPENHQVSNVSANHDPAEYKNIT